MVNWTNIKLTIARWVLGEKWVRDYIEMHLDMALVYFVGELKKAKVLDARTSNKLLRYIAKHETAKEFLEWYLEEGEEESE